MSKPNKQDIAGEILMVEKLEKEMASLREENERLTKILKEYGNHTALCRKDRENIQKAILDFKLTERPTTIQMEYYQNGARDMAKAISAVMNTTGKL